MAKIVGRSGDFRADCRNCGAQIVFTKTDLVPDRSNRVGDEYGAAVRCPTSQDGCGSLVRVSDHRHFTQSDLDAADLDEAYRDAGGW